MFPDDEDTLSIVGEIAVMDPLDMLWQNIVIQYTAIARAQRIMFVTDHDDMSKEVRRTKTMSTEDMDMEENEWEIQFAWDKQATFLQAQSRAIKTLEGLISRYEEILPTSPQAEQHRLRIEKLKADIEKVRGKDNTDDSLTITVDYGDGDG
ncbi:hypothetical protein [Alicyclobacillus fastidiosus]|uniref:hypothetical protein n=1 Tax=Alicyclobacillus fastidiosus TaxID=392011 RepID=UPI0024E13CC3|nr:hypothetical protein [Alicyclobacillus fastidiosus]